MTIRGNTIGISGEDGSAISIDQEGTITGNGTDIVLLFGSRGTFNGDTIGTITCDKTSLLRIDNTDVTCPTP
jgi:hypothetical protein